MKITPTSISRYTKITDCAKSCVQVLCQGMNTAAYLTKQGWQGDGHALHHSGRGIIEPIHISQKTNVFGVGKKQHNAHADQWWARAFDDTLKGLNTTKNEETGKTEGIVFGSGAQALQSVGIGGAKWVGHGALYSNFVRGESLCGTLTYEEKDHWETQSQSEDQRKRKSSSNVVDLDATTTKDVIWTKGKRRHQEHMDEGPDLVSVDSVHQDPRNVAIEAEYENRQERPRGTQTKEQRRQRKREKKARRALEADESCELPEQPRAIASNDLSTCNRPKRRDKEQLPTIEDAELVATRPGNAFLDGKRKGKSGKRR